jgi:hypothetical protein
MEAAQPLMVDLTDPTAIDKALATSEPDGNGRQWSVQLLRGMAERARGTNERRAFLRALASAALPSLSDKILAIEDAVAAWCRQSAAIRDDLHELCDELAGRHAAELLGSDWQSNCGLRYLVRFSGRPGAALIPTIVTALRERVAEVSSTTWLSFATLLAEEASPGAVRAALERFVLRSSSTLPDDLGDGPWRQDLSVRGGPGDAAAGLLWCRLGDPDARGRWRAAVAVRRLVDFGQAEVLSPLVQNVERIDAGAFQDHRLPFFQLHARLWLLISLARIARDAPRIVRPFRRALESVAFSTAFPHALMQQFAADALSGAAQALGPDERDALRERLRSVNLPALPRIRAERRSGIDFYTGRPQDRPKPENAFHFDYDFSKYQVDGLGRVFGAPKWEVDDASTAWIRRWDAHAMDMYECPRLRESDSRIGSYASGSPPQRDRYGGYLAWHALMLVAGEFVRTRPVTGDTWHEDPWTEWLAEQCLSRRDGLWLAEGTDLFPPDFRRAVGVITDDRDEQLSADAAVLAPLVGLNEQFCLGEVLIVDGEWTSADGVDVVVRSVIVEGADEAGQVALAVATGDPFVRWLPRESDIFDRRKGSPLRAWLTAPNHSPHGLDQHDPYATPTALSRARPADWTIAELGLVAGDPFGRVWRDRSGATIATADAWGATRGGRERAWSRTGARVLWMMPSLRNFLSRRGAGLVVLVKACKYLKERSGKDAFEYRTLVFTVDMSGNVRVVLSIPRAVESAIAALGDYKREEFDARFELVRKYAMRSKSCSA